MRTITAKFNSRCAETGTPITRGMECVYDPTAKKVYCLNSRKAKIFFDGAILPKDWVQDPGDLVSDQWAAANL